MRTTRGGPITLAWMETQCIPEPNTGCWLWLGHCNIHSYGTVYTRANKKSRMLGAHRVMYLLAKGPIPDGHCVMHRCDNPPCVNPKHLHPGPPRANTADMMAKGRAGFHERSPRTKLTWSHAEVIRKMTDWGVLTHTQIGQIFGVCPATVNHIHTRRQWDPEKRHTSTGHSAYTQGVRRRRVSSAGAVLSVEYR